MDRTQRTRRCTLNLYKKTQSGFPEITLLLLLSLVGDFIDVPRSLIERYSKFSRFDFILEQLSGCSIS